MKKIKPQKMDFFKGYEQRKDLSKGFIDLDRNFDINVGRAPSRCKFDFNITRAHVKLAAR
jgi:hypothetical protein